MEPAVAVHIRDLTVVRGRTPVVTGLDLDVPAGQAVGLLGPSGGGKSTLMRAIVGVQMVRSGMVEVLGLPAGSAALRRRVAYTTQQPSVYADLTVRENLRYFARLVDASPGRVDDVLGQVDLEDKADSAVDRLSGGQRARVSLAAALLGDPELLVLDEPTVGLDPVLRRDLWALFHRLRDEGRTLLVSSHVMDEAARCDRLVLLREGAVLADATPAELYATTGTDDAEGAFLALIDRASGRVPAPPASDPAPAGGPGRTASDPARTPADGGAA